MTRRLIELALGGDQGAAARLLIEARRRGDGRGQVIALASGAPGVVAWEALCEQLDAQPDDAGLRAALDARLSASWPDALRVTPPRWVDAVLGGEARGWLALARQVDLRRRGAGADAALRALLRGGWLRRMTGLDLSGNAESAGLMEGLREVGVALSAPLERLRLAHNKLDDEALIGLVGARGFGGLRALDVSLNELEGRVIEALAVSASAQTLRRLIASSNRLGPEAVEALCASARSLTALNLNFNPIGARGLEAITATSTLRLERLEVCGVRADVEAFERLLAAPHLATLDHLELSYNALGPRLGQALAASEHLASLRTLHMTANDLGIEGGVALLEARHLATLEALWAARNGLEAPGARALAMGDHLTRLEVLLIGDNDFTPEACALILGAPHLAGLVELDLSGNAVGFAGARALAQRERPFAALRVLNLYSCGLGSEGLGMLVQATLPRLRALKLIRNVLDAAAAHILATAAWLPELRSLELGYNALGDEGLAALAPVLEGSLEQLDLRQNGLSEAGARAFLARVPRPSRLYLGGNDFDERALLG